jgi:hypothetical protein
MEGNGKEATANSQTKRKTGKVGGVVVVVLIQYCVSV